MQSTCDLGLSQGHCVEGHLALLFLLHYVPVWWGLRHITYLTLAFFCSVFSHFRLSTCFYFLLFARRRLLVVGLIHTYSRAPHLNLHLKNVLPLLKTISSPPSIIALLAHELLKQLLGRHPPLMYIELM